MSQVETTSKKGRFNSNLVETVKGYAAHEQEVFSDIAEALKTYSASGANEAAQATMLYQCNRQAFGSFESYRSCRPNFQHLMDELGTENRLRLQEDYNDD